MLGHRHQRSKHVLEEIREVPDEWCHQLLVAALIRPKIDGGLRQRVVQDRGGVSG